MNKALIDDIIEFWFADEVAALWFKSTETFDEEVTQRYEKVWQQAADGLLDHWQKTELGCLALVIVLDQFPLNMFRDHAKSYSTEAKSRQIAQYAIAQNYDAVLTPRQKVFLYLPYMHSENLSDQQTAIDLFTAAGLDNNVRYAQHHYAVVERFARFPHRNEALGRVSTVQEIAYLETSNW